jgi:hypothetical protein
MYALIIIKTTCTSCHGYGTFEALNSIYGEKSQLESEKEVEKIKHSIYNGSASTRTSKRLRLDSVSRAPRGGSRRPDVTRTAQPHTGTAHALLASTRLDVCACSAAPQQLQQVGHIAT